VLLNVEDYRRKAKRKLPKFAFDYVDGGAENEHTLALNRSAFEKWGFVPSVLVNCDDRNTDVQWLGETYSAPLAIAPTGYNGMLHHNADVHLALAASKLGIPYIQSTVSTNSIEEIGQHQLTNHWFQLYVLRDRDATRDLIERAKQQGCKTLVVSVDAVYFGNRERDKRNYSKPFHLSWRSKLNIAMNPMWVKRVILPQGVPVFGNLVPYIPKQHQKGVQAAAYFAQQMDPNMDWTTIEWIRELWQGKLLIKGIMSGSDACRAIDIGCDGVVLSNHGGRQLDSTISPLDRVNQVREAIGVKPLLLVDSGFRRGTDIVKAIALGANGVLIGRPALYALAAEGQQGVLDVMMRLQQEVDRTLAQLGCRSIRDLNLSLLERV